MFGKPQYQLILLGDGTDRWRRSLVRALRQRLSQFGPTLDRSLEVVTAATLGRVNPVRPAVAVYFGGDPSVDAAEAAQVAAMSIPLIPAVPALDRFVSLVPTILRPINGMTLASSRDLPALVNLVLENLALIRRTRRLFLSYRRYEASTAAQQLRTAFDALGYDAFLDTNSVPRGDDFQLVLWHRLLDSDVLVALDTADFLGSRYTQMEIANASAMSVGMLQVLWPGVRRSAHSLLTAPLHLKSGDFEGDALTESAVRRIATATEGLRARCVAARHANLVGEFCAEAIRSGATISVQPERYVLAKLRSGRRIAAIPAVGVPDALRYHEASARFSVGGVDADEAVLIYDHRGMLPHWMRFLDWLDDFLPVKGLRVTDTAARLGAM